MNTEGTVLLPDAFRHAGEEIASRDAVPAFAALCRAIRELWERACRPSRAADVPLYWEDDVVSGVYVTPAGP